MKTLTIIWAAMLFSLAAYLAVGIYAARSFPKSIDEKSVQIMRNTFYGLSLLTVVATRYLRKIVLSSKAAGSHGDAVFRHPALARYSKAMVTSLAMSESIGIYGLVLAFLGGNEADLFLLVAIAAAAMWYYRPRKDEVEDLAQQLRQPRHPV